MFVFGVILTGFAVRRQEGSTRSCKFLSGPNVWWYSVISWRQETSGVLSIGGPQPFWHHGPFSRRIIFSLTGVEHGFGMIQPRYFYCVLLLLLFSCSVVSVSLWPPWTAAHQASLSCTISQSLLKLMSIVGDAIQPCHPRLPPFSPALNLSQHQGL